MSLSCSREWCMIYCYLPLDNTFADFGINSGTDLVFVAIDMSAIDVTVANINRIFNSLRYFAGWWLNEKNKSRNQLNSRIPNSHNRMNWCKLELTVKLEKSTKGQMNHIARRSKIIKCVCLTSVAKKNSSITGGFHNCMCDLLHKISSETKSCCQICEIGANDSVTSVLSHISKII